MIVLCAWMVLMTFSCRWIAGSWLHPSPVTSATWTVAVATAALGSLPVGPDGARVLLLAQLAALVAAPITVKRPLSAARLVSHRLAARYVLAGSLAPIISLLLVLRANGIALTSVLSLDNLLSTASALTEARYTHTLSTPLLATGLLAVGYSAALLAPMVASDLPRWKRICVTAAPTLGQALYSFSTTAKAGMIISALLSLGAWMIVRALAQGGRPRVDARATLTAAIAGAAIVASFIAITAVRTGGDSADRRQVVADHVLVYVGGGVSALDAWLQAPADAPRYRFGASTFAGMSKYLLNDHTIGSAYADFRQVKSETTNIFTVIRPLADDFSVPGAVLALAAAAILSAALFRRAVVRRSIPSTVLAAALIGFALFSPATSIFTFTSVCLGTLLATAVASRLISIRQVFPAEEASTDASLRGQKREVAHGTLK